MGFRFVGQPFPENDQIGEVVRSALKEPDAIHLWVATAWGKQSGLSRIAKEIEALRDRGGYAECIVGVDEGGATVEGLNRTVELFDAPYVFHDPGQRTFHPKIYVVQNDDRAVAVVGSGTLTRGGLFTNYEGSIVADLDLHDPDDAAFFAGVRDYYERLKGLGDACKPLSLETIEQLKRDPRVIVESERQANRQRRDRQRRGRSTLFGDGAVPGLLGAPPPATQPLPDDEADDDTLEPRESPDHHQAGGETGEPRVTSGGFFKALSKNDVSLKDSPGQIIIPIGFLPFFGELSVQKDESAQGGPRQEHREFSVTFRDGDFVQIVQTGRVILYEPAKNHKRQNSEVRFTFRDREILTRLAEGDVLVFGYEGGGMVVERRENGWRPAGVPSNTRFGTL